MEDPQVGGWEWVVARNVVDPLKQGRHSEQQNPISGVSALSSTLGSQYLEWESCKTRPNAGMGWGRDQLSWFVQLV